MMSCRALPSLLIASAALSGCHVVESYELAHTPAPDIIPTRAVQHDADHVFESAVATLLDDGIMIWSADESEGVINVCFPPPREGQFETPADPSVGSDPWRRRYIVIEETPTGSRIAFVASWAHEWPSEERVEIDGLLERIARRTQSGDDSSPQWPIVQAPPAVVYAALAEALGDARFGLTSDGAKSRFLCARRGTTSGSRAAEETLMTPIQAIAYAPMTWGLSLVLAPAFMIEGPEHRQEYLAFQVADHSDGSMLRIVGAGSSDEGIALGLEQIESMLGQRLAERRQIEWHRP